MPLLQLIVDGCVAVLQPLDVGLLAEEVRTVFTEPSLQGTAGLAHVVQVSAQFVQLVLL